MSPSIINVPYAIMHAGLQLGFSEFAVNNAA